MSDMKKVVLRHWIPCNFRVGPVQARAAWPSCFFHRAQAETGEFARANPKVTLSNGVSANAKVSAGHRNKRKSCIY